MGYLRAFSRYTKTFLASKINIFRTNQNLVATNLSNVDRDHMTIRQMTFKIMNHDHSYNIYVLTSPALKKSGHRRGNPKLNKALQIITLILIYEFNKNKIQYQQKDIRYLGHVFSEQGMRVDDEKIKAIQNLKIPENRKQLQGLLGIINYNLRSLIPNLSNLTGPLTELLKSHLPWFGLKNKPML